MVALQFVVNTGSLPFASVITAELLIDPFAREQFLQLKLGELRWLEMVGESVELVVGVGFAVLLVNKSVIAPFGASEHWVAGLANKERL